MTDRTTTIQLLQSMKFLSAAFEEGALAAHRAEAMRLELYDDTALVQTVLEIPRFNTPDEQQRAWMLDAMERPAFKAMVDRVNHLTSPEMYSPLKLQCEHVALGYWELKCSIGNLQAALMPSPGVYDRPPALTA